MNATGKMLVEIKSTSLDTKAPNGSFAAVLSVPTLDRDKEIVDAAAFEPLPDHITIDLDHAMTVERTVGSGRPFYDGNVLRFEGTYASTPLAQMTRTLVDEGHIRTMSVAYMNARYEVDPNDGVNHMRSAELLNAGIVGIPANRDALITASKSLRELLAVEPSALISTDEARAAEALPPIAGSISTEESPEGKAAAAVAAAAEPPAVSEVGRLLVLRARVQALLLDVD
jgi:HK97 family phage prohead protease